MLSEDPGEGETLRRAWAAGAFAAAALLLGGTLFVPAFRRTGDLVTLGLYVALPGLSGALAGWLRGPAFGPGRTSGIRAAVKGAMTGMLGLIIHAPLFALGITWLEPDWSSFLGLTALTFWVGLVALGWVIAGVGALTGWAVWRFGPK